MINTSNVQKSELLNTPNINRRNALLDIYEQLKQEKLDSEEGIWIDDLIWDDDNSSWCDQPSLEFIELQDGKFKNSKDAFIGALAKRNNIILVSNDKDFIRKCDKCEIYNITPEEFIAR